ncbi:hypothetical protein FBEOM_10546 [Fusarium beomiforme]|uniref:Uncharacterized protein n=1 Tax=Fusarium beomiforme TaxID=44412 RepID=A0A9P5ABA6_9HYPO|nr:hypothetical protein FBEOM_10546 [Fusarium beomiforme]
MAGRDDRIGRGPVDYRDQATDRYQNPPTELFPGRNSSRRDESSHLKNANHDRGRGGGRGGGTPHGQYSKRFTNASDRGYLPSVLDLLGDAAYYRMQQNQADNKLRKTKTDLRRSTTKAPEFASVDEMQNQAIKKCEEEKNGYKQKLKEMHPTLHDAFGSLVEQYVEEQLSMGPNAHQRTTSPQAEVQDSPVDLDSLSIELQKPTTAWVETYVQTELDKFRVFFSNSRDPDNKEIQKLLDNFEDEKKKNQLLETKVKESRQQNQLLEAKLNKLEQKLDSVNTTIEGWLSTVIEEEISKKLLILDNNQKKDQTPKIDTITQLQKSTESHTQQLADHRRQLVDLKREPAVAKTSEAVASFTTEEYTRLKETVEMQGRKIHFLHDQFDLGGMQKLQQDAESLADKLTRDIKSARSLHKENSVLVEQQGKKQKSLENDILSLQSTSQSQGAKQDSLENDISSLRSTCKSHELKQKSLEKDISLLRSTSQNQGEKQRTMDSVVSGLNSVVERHSQNGESLAEEIASLRSSVELRLGSQDKQLSALTPLKSQSKEQEKKINVLQQTVDALQTSTADWSLQNFKSLEARVQEFPPSGEIKHLLVEFPSLLDAKHLIAEYPPPGDIKRMLEKMPPPEEIKHLLDEYPPPADIQRLLEEIPPSKELNQLVKDVPKLRESMSEVSARSSLPSTPTITSASMAKEVKQIFEPKIQKTEELLKAFCKRMILTCCGKLEKDLEQVSIGTSKSEEAVRALDAHFTSLKQNVDENKKEFDAHAKTLQRSVDDNKKELSKRIVSLDERHNETRVELNDMHNDLVSCLEKQTTELKSAKAMVAVMYQDIEKVSKDSKTGVDDVQFQLVQLTDWTKNFSTKGWYETVAQQITAHVPGQFVAQVDGLATRISHLEARVNDSSEVSNKRRKAANGSPVVVNCIH